MLTDPAAAVPALIQALVDDSHHVRRMAVYALAKRVNQRLKLCPP